MNSMLIAILKKSENITDHVLVNPTTPSFLARTLTIQKEIITREPFIKPRYQPPWIWTDSPTKIPRWEIFLESPSRILIIESARITFVRVGENGARLLPVYYDRRPRNSRFIIVDIGTGVRMGGRFPGR